MMWLLKIAIVAVLSAGLQAVDIGVSDSLFHHSPNVPRPNNAPYSGHRAFKFTSGMPPLCRVSFPTRNIIDAIRPACTSGCFTISSSVRVESKTPQTMMSVSLPMSRFSIRFRRNTELRIRYTSTDYHNYYHRFLYQFRQDQWYDLAITICPTERRILMRVDCNLIYNETMPRAVLCRPDVLQGSVCMGGDRVVVNEGFVGSMQNLRINTGDSPVACTNPAAQMQQSLDTCRAALKQCSYNGHKKAHGESWPERTLCRTCYCQNKQVNCIAMACPRTTSCNAGQNMVLQPANATMGQCCPFCKRVESPSSCRVNGRVYTDGAAMPNGASGACRSRCICRNGVNVCARQTQCPRLNPANCPGGIKTRLGQCCPECLSYDKCAQEQPCGPTKYSICYNLNRGKAHYCELICRNGGRKVNGKCQAPRSG